MLFQGQLVHMVIIGTQIALVASASHNHQTYKAASPLSSLPICPFAHFRESLHSLDKLPHSKMSSQRNWDDYETAIVVYFASRRATHEGCKRILSHKSAGAYERSLFSIRGKLDQVRTIPGLWSNNGWNLEAVDTWIAGLEISDLQAAITVGYDEMTCVPLVSLGRGLFYLGTLTVRPRQAARHFWMR